MTSSRPASEPPDRRRLGSLPGLRVLAAWGVPGTLRVAAAVALVIGLAWVIANSRPWVGDPTTWIADTGNYYAAGERLNVGHSLYAYGPGDRHVLELLFGLPSPYLYPPLVGVLWRPVAAFVPYETAVVAWWAVSLVAYVGTLVVLLRRGGSTTAAGVLILLVPIAITAWTGNVSELLLVAILGAWFALGRGHDRLAGAIIGFTAVVKLTPAFLAWWLVVTRRWNALAAAVVAGAVSLAVGLVGAGLADHLTFLHVSDAVARAGGIQGSLVNLLRLLGAGPDALALVAPVVSIAGVLAIWLLRHRERAAWAVAIATGVFASPIFNLTNVTLLLAAFVAMDDRFAWPAAMTPRASTPAPTQRLGPDPASAG